MHETEEEAREETLRMLHVYSDFYKETLAIPAVIGRKTEKEKFAGAEETYTIEPMMHNGVALQGGTSHYFGDGFAKSFGITYTGKDNKLHYPHQTSWGVSTRMIGALIMVHSDDDGLVLPPKISPIQVALIPVAQHKEGVLEKAEELRKALAEKFRVKLDSSDHAPGWKFAEYEMKGVPVRVEIGPKDIEKNQCVVVRRDTREKAFVSIDELVPFVETLWLQSTTICMTVLSETRRKRHSRQQHLMSSLTQPRTSPALSRRCGAVKQPVKRKSKKLQAV